MDAASTPGLTNGDPGPIHVHGLGINPRDGALFVASHTGLFRSAPGQQTATRVGDRFQDTMGFAVVGPDRFIGSGHPDLRDKLPPFLGLIRSQNAGRDWKPVSLLGKADFHVLEASGDRVVGYGTNWRTRAAQLLVSDDGGRDWSYRRAPAPLLDMAISPDEWDTIVASGERGLYRSEDGARSFEDLGGTPGLLGWHPLDGLYRVALDGEVAQSGDAGSSWTAVGRVGGEPAAFEAASDALYVALHDGVVKMSRDRGMSWSVRARPQASSGPSS